MGRREGEKSHGLLDYQFRDVGGGREIIPSVHSVMFKQKFYKSSFVSVEVEIREFWDSVECEKLDIGHII